MLGIDFVYKRESGKLLMSLKRQIACVYHRNQHDIPMTTKIPLDNKTVLDLVSPAAADVFRFRSNVDALNYIATSTRPDISYYGNQLAKYMKAPTEHHQQLALKVIAYLHETINYALAFQGQPESDLLVWSDSNFKPTAPRCSTGTLVQFGSIPILWPSKAQSVVAADSCFAELFAINASLKRGLYVRNLMIEIGIRRPDDLRIRMLVDNKTAKTITETVLGSSSKHYHPNMTWQTCTPNSWCTFRCLFPLYLTNCIMCILS